MCSSDLALNVPSSRSALVERVLPKSPADKAGIKAGDLIVEANGKPILDFGQLRNMVGLMRVDDKVDLKLYRGGKPKNISVKIGKDDKIADASALTKDVRSEEHTSEHQ